MTASVPTFSRRSPHWIALACLPSLVWAGQPSSTTVGPVTIPAQWQAPASVAGALDTAALAQWWQRFNDPVLDQLVADALGHSPDLRTALSKIAAARATRNSERSGLFPSLTAGASGAGTRSHARSSDTTATAESYGASLDASWEIDLFGQQRLAVSAATAELAQATDHLHAAQVSLAAEVASAYISLRSAEVQFTAVASSIAAQSETTQIAQWREQAGLASSLDARKAVSTLEQARATLPALQQTLSETRNQLATLCGRTPGELDSLLTATQVMPVVPAGLAVGIPAETLRQRPDIRAAERGLAAAVARTKSAERDRLPTLSLSGSLGVESLKAGDIFSPERTIAKLVGGLTAPIFSAGRIRAAIEIRTESERQALIAYESAVLAALAEVENAQTAVARTGERLGSLTRAAAAAREAATLAAQQYQAGEADLLVLLDAQRSALALDQQQVAAVAAQLSAHIQLYKSLGGGWNAATL